MTKTKLFLFIFIIMILGGIGMAIFLWKKPVIYCNDYYGVVNRADNRSYKDMINQNGPIERTEIIDNVEYVHYEDGRIFVFEIIKSGNRWLCRIDVTGEEFRFGREQIGVGTDKKTIEKIYKRHAEKRYINNNQFWVIDAKQDLDFYFDDNDRVYEISIGYPDVYR